jgi:hypothetical protein
MMKIALSSKYSPDPEKRLAEALQPPKGPPFDT